MVRPGRKAMEPGKAGHRSRTALTPAGSAGDIPSEDMSPADISPADIPQ